jgi:hypothetical protein
MASLAWTPVTDDTSAWKLVAPTQSPVAAGLPAGTRPAGLPAGMNLPGLPALPPAKMSAPVPSTPGSRLLGISPIADAEQVVGTHLKNLIAGPYHALTDAPRNSLEAQEMVASPDSGLVARGLGHLGLAAARMFVNPTIDATKEASTQVKAGNWNGQDYDANGAYHPNAPDAMMDAIPLAGPWARSIENDAQQHGAVPALMGAGVDYAAPSAAGELVGGIAKPLSRRLAVSDVTNMVRPSGNDAAFGKQPAVGLLDQPGGTRAWSLPGLLDKSKANLNDAGAAVTNQVANAPQTPLDISGTVANPFNSALSDAARLNNRTLFGRLQEARDGLTTNQTFDPSSDSILQVPGPKNLVAVTPNDVLGIKRDVGGQMRWTNQAFDNEVNSTYGDVYGGLKNTLDNAVPGLEPISSNYGNLKAGVSALERRIPIEERNNPISLNDAVIGGGAAAATGLVPAAGAILAKKALLSTPIRTGLQTGLWNYGVRPSALSAPNIFRLGATIGGDDFLNK